MVAYIDKVIGRIVGWLEELKLRSDTLLLFTADNGTNSNIASQMGKHSIQGGKAQLTDAGTHVPLIVNWPGTAPPGRVCDDLVDFTDIMPTLAQCAQAPLPEDVIIDGCSFLPQIKGQTGQPRDWVFFHYEPRFPWKDYGKTRVVRNQRWKLYDNGNFFDLKLDPQETNPLNLEDLSQETQETRTRLEKVLDSMGKKTKR